MRAEESGPRRLDPHQAGKVTETTIRRYRKGVAPFVAWLIEQRFNPTQASEWDDLLVEFKNDKLITLSQFSLAVAGVEFLFPHFRGQLRWSRATLAGWAVVHTPAHTVPLCAGPAHLIAVHMAALGHPKLGAGVLLQQHLGLRPSEVLSLERQDIALPREANLGGSSSAAVVGLGMRSGTKAKRAQSVLLCDRTMLALLSWLVSESQDGQRMIPYSYEQYRRLLKKITSTVLHLDIAWTPHSPRAGFASDATAAGRSFTEICEAGRWIADSSLRTYIDVVSAASISTNLRLSGMRPAIIYAREHIFEFVPWALLFLENAPEDGASGARRVCANLEGGVGPKTRWLPITKDEAHSGDDSNAPKPSGAHAVTAGSAVAGTGRSDGRVMAQRGRGRGRR